MLTKLNDSVNEYDDNDKIRCSEMKYQLKAVNST